MTATPPPRAFTEADASKFLKRGYDALKVRNFKDAGACCNLVLKYMPKAKEAHFLVGLVAIETADWKTAHHAMNNVVAIDENHAAGWAQLSRIYMQLGQYSNAEKAVEKSIDQAPTDPLVQDVIGTVFSLLGYQQKALYWFDKACEASGRGAFELSRAKSLTFLGRIDEAKVALERVVQDRPNAAQAHWMLARTQKAVDSSHIEEMQAQAARDPEGHPNQPFWQYAIGKELEDLERWDDAFNAYSKGASARRKEVAFDEGAEIAMFDALSKTFTKEWFDTARGGHETDAPIFIVGQPRTGTTLIERIITAHSDVASAGELQQFGMAIRRSVKANTPRTLTPEAVAEIAGADMKALGELYMHTTRSVRPEAPKFVDKLPANYLYAPLIAAAFPGAKIIHLVRDPIDSCVSSYKQLFAEAYYHSYDLEEMARHHVRYRKLMENWRQVLRNRMLDVVYEDTVQNLEENAKNIIDFIGLEWQDACLDFHKQEGAVTTASAVQVREKAHNRSVGRWQKFEGFLDPVKRILNEEGLL
jgi:tetratricopeptide (TPR) repeat protein